MDNYGIIDMGSNTIRMVIYAVDCKGKTKKGARIFTSLLSDKVFAGLAAYVDDGVFTQAGIDKAIKVLKGHLKRSKYYKCKKMEVIATAVLRNCSNRDDAVRQISKECNIPIRVLSEYEEAYLGFVGASIAESIGNGTLLYIGGGSTELTRVLEGYPRTSVSLPQGSLSSFSMYVEGVFPSEAEMKTIRAEMRKQCEALPSSRIFRTDSFFGIGGSIRGAAKVLQQMDKLKKRPDRITHDDLWRICDLSLTNPNAFVHIAAAAVPERIHTIIPGCLIALELMELMNASHIEICKRGLREGYLLEYLLKG